jgi:iron complex transport system substrate-binding protein
LVETIDTAKRGSSNFTRRRLIALAAAIAPVAALGWGRSVWASATPEAQGGTRTFVDVTGEAVEVPVPPARIVAIHDINAGAQVLSLGGPLVGITSRDEGPRDDITRYFDLSDITDVGATYAPNLEAIAALNPDLIVGEGFAGAVVVGDETELARLRQIAPVVGIDTFRPVEVVMAEYAELLGDAATVDMDGQRQEFEALLDALGGLHGGAWEDVTASLVDLHPDGGMQAWGPTALVPTDILTRIGVSWVPIMEEAGKPENGGYIGNISVERLPEFEADLVLVKTAFTPEIVDDPLFRALTAVRAGQVVELGEEDAGTHYPNYIFVAEVLLDQLRGMELRTDIV